MEKHFALESIRHFCRETVRPASLTWDAEEQFSDSVLHLLAERGYFGCLVPETFGGAGWSFEQYCALVEELATADPSLAFMVAAHNSLCTNHILRFGSEAQKERYLPKLASGEWIGSWALTEADAGSDATAIQTRAERTESGWKLDGEKKFITNAARAGVNVVIAAVAGRRTRISAFIIEASNPGRQVGARLHTMGMKASQTYVVHFRDCELPEEALLGDEGKGLAHAMKLLDGGRIATAALALGLARGAYEDAVAYARKRQQFMRPIIEHPTIKGMLVDMHIAIATARAAVESAIRSYNADRGVSTQAAIAKLVASQAAVKVAEQSLQIHGGNGYLVGNRPEKLYRDAKVCTIAEGTNEILRLVVAREVEKSHSTLESPTSIHA